MKSAVKVAVGGASKAAPKPRLQAGAARTTKAAKTGGTGRTGKTNPGTRLPDRGLDLAAEGPARR